MGILAHAKIYLAGQIESDPNERSWRLELTTSLHKIEPTLTIWDPLIKPRWVPINTVNHVAFGLKDRVFIENCQSSEQWLDEGALCLEANKQVRFHCKMLANKCDILIIRLSKAFTWGTIDEVEIAINRNIPRFLWLPDGPVSIYGLAGCIDKLHTMNTYIHKSSGSLLNTIQSINIGNLDVASDDPEMWSYITWPKAGDKL